MGDLTKRIEELAENFEHRCTFVSALRRVNKRQLLYKCAADLRSLLASPPAPSAAPREQGTVPPEVREAIREYGASENECGAIETRADSNAQEHIDAEAVCREKWAALDAAILAYGASERERGREEAARICDGTADGWTEEEKDHRDGLLLNAAARIRSLGERGGGANG